MKKILYAAVSFAPMLALAQSATQTVAALSPLATALRNLLNLVIPILLILAVIYFFWGLITYIRAVGDEKARAQGKSQMLWGIIAIVVMVSLFAVIGWVQNTLGLSGTATITIPSI